MKRDERNKELEKTIRALWSSYESHLAYTHLRSTEGKAWHRKCCREYADEISRLTYLL
jgi:hypothetical protein